MKSLLGFKETTPIGIEIGDWATWYSMVMSLDPLYTISVGSLRFLQLCYEITSREKEADVSLEKEPPF